MALAARSPGGPEARVPCPLCGGLIHPVAGRCKHCRQDLTGHRNARPAAAAALPALVGGAAGPAALPALVGGAAGPAVVGGAAGPEPLRARDLAVPVAAVSPSGTAIAAPLGWWRRWPVIAIALASIAIVVALVALLWPPHRAAATGAPPAPNAPTGTDPEPAQRDPWGTTQGRADPPPPAAPSDPATPPPAAAAPTPAPSLPDPLPPDPTGGVVGGSLGGPVNGGTAGQLHGALGGGLLGPGGAPTTTAGSAFMMTALAHACAKLQTCPDPDAGLSAMCDAFASLPHPPPPAGCDAATRCLNAIDHMSCSQTTGDMPASVLMMFQDCSTAMTSC